MREEDICGRSSDLVLVYVFYLNSEAYATHFGLHLIQLHACSVVPIRSSRGNRENKLILLITHFEKLRGFFFFHQLSY